MFTERNMLGMIVFHYSSHKEFPNKTILFPQPFNKKGAKAYAQNFTSTKFYCLYYSIMDFVIWNQSDKECGLNKFQFKSEFNYNVIRNFFNYLNSGCISLIQFNWSDSEGMFNSNRIAKIEFDSKDKKFKLFYLGELKPCSH